MGQGQSGETRAPRTHEELVKELANRFATKCFTPLELYSLKDNFKALADATEDSQHIIRDQSEDAFDAGESAPVEETRKPQVVRYLKEDTVARFLAIPDILGASPVVFQMLTYMGSFPFLNDGPAVLGLEQLVMVVTLLTDRYKRVLSHGASDRRTLLFRSLAVHDRKLFSEDRKESSSSAATAETTQPAQAPLGFAVDAPADDDEDMEDGLGLGANDDDLVLAAFEALDYVDPLPRERKGELGRKTAAETATTLHGARIPADNFRKLLMLLLLVAPLNPQEPLSLYADRFTGEALESLRATSQCVLTTFLDVETSPGIKFAHFDSIIPVCFPFIFNGLSALFERFLFSKNLDLSRTKPVAGSDSTGDTSGMAESNSPRKRTSSAIAGKAVKDALLPPPLLLQESDNTIMNLNILSQLSFFIPGSSLFHSLRLLYSGDNDGFSMGSFETKVFNWRAPTILLVKGSRISDAPRGGQQAAFSAALPPRRFPYGNGNLDGSGSSGDDDDEEPLIFGAYVSQPWQMTHRECFGNSDMLLFQLSPVHDVFGASTINQDYAAFVKPSAANQHSGGIGFGCPSPSGTAVKASLKQQHQSIEGVLPIGPLSLMIDANLEFGVMTHDRGHRGSASTSMGSSYSSGGSGGGGAFHSSVARTFSFQERFSIESLEVWGCGGHVEAQAQADRWAWEAREAEARRRINLGTGDVEADRALLEMAGLVGANRSGGSMV
ncbi:tldc domain containing protein 2 [Ophiostoma piceae UAMH 11346]|uniref:Restriction of telomere capping protein 5 n=1 Tax=Ophiostoma piceae (strain UAMH 11346) TaxID=1262450 RepID=S3BT70_OPHP1|nr:tldc domain containing protein 2 [Ophiostoma piceae UAMH 11346]